MLKLFSPKENPSFLHIEFEKEYHYANALLLSLQAYRRQDLPQVKAEAQRILQEIPANTDPNAGIYKRTRTYLDDVLSVEL